MISPTLSYKFQSKIFALIYLKKGVSCNCSFCTFSDKAKTDLLLEIFNSFVINYKVIFLLLNIKLLFRLNHVK